MKNIKRSLFFNLFLVSIVIMNIAAFVSWRNEKMKMEQSKEEVHDVTNNDVANGSDESVNKDAQIADNAEAVHGTESIANTEIIYHEAENSEEKDDLGNMPPEKKFVKKDVSYFDDAAFIGDSRVVGIKLYSGIENGAFYCKEGLTVYNMFEEPLEMPGGSKDTLENALTNNQYKKIYLEIGINEIGIGTIDSFMEQYKSSVDHIRELQPDAAIFLCGILHVKKEKSESEPVFNNGNISARNDRIAQLADNRTVFYVDINESVVDDEGNLNPDYTYDAVHLLGKYYGLLSDCLLEHAVEWP